LPELRLTIRAQTDIKNALRFSKQRWGSAVRDDFRAWLRAAFEDIAQFPKIGFHDDRLPDNVRIRPVMSHRIIYRVTQQEVLVLRVLHYRQSLPEIDE
jgi:toxin ParE1/3/4